MAENKTTATRLSVAKFIAGIPDEDRRAECRTLLKLFKTTTGKPAVMWGPSIVGFGKYHYKYASGREGDWFLAGFSPRKQALTVYLMAGFAASAPLLKKLGQFKKSGGSCLYIKRLSDIDLDVLQEMIRRSVFAVQERVKAATSR
jgi:hypothetical protein